MFFKQITDWMDKKNRQRASEIIKRIHPYLGKSKKIIDIGSGVGDITHILKEQKKQVTPVDVESYHIRRVVNPIIYDGKNLPFPNRLFDTSLLLMVLHHTPDPYVVFSEAARVGKELVVIETTYMNLFEKIYTVLIDTVANAQLIFHWNSYKKDEDWRNFFKAKNFTVVSAQHHLDKVLGISFRHVVYYLRRLQN